MRGRWKWPRTREVAITRRQWSGAHEQQQPVRITAAARGPTASGRIRMTIGCPECGTLEQIPPLEPRSLARCRAGRGGAGRSAQPRTWGALRPHRGVDQRTLSLRIADPVLVIRHLMACD